jgi:predicted RND superfamily exporter protein
MEPEGAARRAVEPAPPASSPWLKRALEALSLLQTKHPYAVLLVALLSMALSGLAASRLTLKTSLSELLPANKESVIVAQEVSKRLSTTSTLFIVAEGNDAQALKRFVDELAPALKSLPPNLAGSIEAGVHESRKFLEANKLLYAPLEDVQKVHDEILARYEREVQKQAGLDLGLDEGEDAPAPLTAEAIRARLAGNKGAIAAAEERFPDGYYMEPAGKLITVVVRTPIAAGDVDRSRALLDAVNEVIAKVDPKRFDPAMTINFAGNLITAMEEYSQIKGDLSEVGLVGVAMILGVVFLFYMRVRTLLAMALTVAVGTMWTFGVAYLLIGHLNASTGFLVSIVVGNGINFGIIYMARYMEERRTGGVYESVVAAHADTWLATLAAAGAAMVAYGSLFVTDFRGFKHFGIIGGLGMLLCWLGTYLTLPSILAASERIYAIRPDTGLAARLRAAYGKPFAFLIDRFPRAIAVGSLLLGIGGVALTVRYVAEDPIEYDMSKTRTEPKTGDSIARKLIRRVDIIVGRQGNDGLAIMVDRLDQVRPLRQALEARRAAAPPNRKPFDKIADIFDLLPKDQEAKIKLIEEARDRLERAHRRGFIAEADWLELKRYIPDGAIKPIGVDDLPEQVARMFIEKDGTRGRLVYIVPSTGRSVWDGHYLIEWADTFRTTTLPDGSVIKGSGAAVIFADVLLAVVEDAPKAILFSIIGTLLIIIIAFRGRASALIVIGTLVMGLLWMMAALSLYDARFTWTGGVPDIDLVGLKLNFLSFIALPISVGVGADYALNIVQRYRLSGGGGGSAGDARIRDVVIETGGAVILCSLTTILGYFALTMSINRAIVSFGFAAAAGELSCLLAAVLALPAFLVWRARRRRARLPVEPPST